MLGMSPFDISYSPFSSSAPRRRSRAPMRAAPRVAPRVAPHIDMRTDDDKYIVTLSAPKGHSLVEPSASPIDAHSILLEGSIGLDQRSNVYEYVSRTRVPVYAEPSHHARPYGVLPPGSVVRGSAPSNRGWIAIDDDESWVCDDGSLALSYEPSTPSTHAFAKRVALPKDADLSRATMRRRGGGRSDEGAQQRFSVVYNGPRVAIRAAMHTGAAILGCLSRGDVVEGCIDEADRNWVRLTDRSAGFVMIQHPQFGQLLAPAAPARVSSESESGIIVHVPRRPRPQPTKQTGPTPHPSASVPSRRAAPKAHSSPVRVRPSAVEARQPTKRQAVKEAGGMHDVLGDSPSAAVLHECASSTANVQSPLETIEDWVAIEGGGFAPTASRGA